LGALIKGCVL